MIFVRFICALCLFKGIDFKQAVGCSVNTLVVDNEISNLLNRPGLGIGVDMAEADPDDDADDDGFDADIDELCNLLNRLDIGCDMEVDGENPAAGQDKSQYVTPCTITPC